MPSKKKALKVYLDSKEHLHLVRQSSRVHLSMSAYAKRLILGYEIKSTVEHEAVLRLIQASAELGRLGGLLKHELKEQRLARTPATTTIINEITSNKEELMVRARELAGHDRCQD